MIATSIRTIISCSAFAGLLVLSWFALVLPASDWKTNRFAKQHRSVIEIQKLSASIDALQLERAQLQQDETLDIIWTEKSLGEVSARIQSKLNTMAQSKGISLRSIAPITPVDLPFADGVGFRMEGEAPLDRVAAFLQILEYSKPVLIVQRASLRRLNRAGETPAQPMLFLQIDVSAPSLTKSEGSE